MKKGDVWYLKDTSDHNRILAKFEFTDDFFTGHLWEAAAWYSDDTKVIAQWYFVADVYCKWDACTHWYFNGETFDPVEDAKTHDNEIDAYYHLCGGDGVFSHIRLMCFVWKLAEMIFGHPTESPSMVNNEYYKCHEGMNKLVELMLKDCVIVKEV